MLVSVIGFFISIYHIYPFWDRTWGFTFAVFFFVLFVASLVSMNGSGLSEEDMAELAVHEQHVRSGRHRAR